ncbi:hypothetical protein EV193_103214 [Herbihabitans rhizosphaerae]|uniref:Uncharacterized protein n=1 Tax=Herbihabitans rhizosphaerae TaxID=1872711 RepID=A0A4Q7KV70_9PSEU|nr:hypothetical protein EV193_103214 [Herbihabitans rhizosphaerae]
MEPVAEARRRRRLDEVFGDVLPDTTADERGADGPNQDTEAWYRHNRPPHHGG